MYLSGLCYFQSISFTNILADGISMSEYFIEDQGLLWKDGWQIRICGICLRYLQQSKLPPLAIANGLDIGQPPSDLPQLTYAEEILVARVRVRAVILKIVNEKIGDSSTNQRKLRGHVISFPQNTQSVCDILPIPPAALVESIKIVFIGSESSPETMQEALKKAKTVTVRKAVVLSWLKFLKKSNPLYADVTIDETRLENLPTN